jgi:hypothetical protein
MSKKLIIPGMLLVFLGISDCKSLISVAEGQSKGKVYATIAEPDGFFSPAKYYVAQCTHDGEKVNCKDENVKVKVK